MRSRDYLNEFFHEDSFGDEEAVRTFLSPAPGEEGLSSPSEPQEGELESLCSYPPLSAEQEAHLFRKLNCLKCLASRAGSEEEKQDRLIQASWVRNIILKHNLRLIANVAKPYARPFLPLMELLSEASMWMMTGIIDSYDYRLGVPFGAFAAGAVRKDLWNYLDKVKREKSQTGDFKLCSVEDHRRGEHEASQVEDELEKLREYLYANASDEKTLDIVCRRLGLNNGKMQSFQEIAKTYGLRWQTIQQQFDRAMIQLFGRTVNGNFIRSLQGRQNDNDRRRHVPSVSLRHIDA